MQKSVDEVVDGIQDLVSLPEVYIKVRELLIDPASSTEDFSKVVSFDPGLAAKILRIANSAFFGFATRIDSINRAINIIGTGLLHDLVLATSAVNIFKDIPEELENMELFWKRNIYSGVMAQLIGSKCNSLDSERYFVIGLLHNIGHLAFCLQLPKEIYAAMEYSRNNAISLDKAEREIIGFDYAELGSRLVESWKLPEAFVETIKHQLNPGKANTYQLEAAAIHIANHTAHVKQTSPDNEINVVHDIMPSAWQITALNKDDAEHLKVECDVHYEEAQMLFMNQM